VEGIVVDNAVFSLSIALSVRQQTPDGRTDGRTDFYVILYSVPCICIALHWADNNFGASENTKLVHVVRREAGMKIWVRIFEGLHFPSFRVPNLARFWTTLEISTSGKWRYQQQSLPRSRTKIRWTLVQ